MKFAVSKSGIKDALATVKNCVPDKPLSEVDGHIRVLIEEGSMTLSATEGMFSAKVTVSIDIEGTLKEPLEFPVDPKRLEKSITKNESDIFVSMEWLGFDKGIRIYTRNAGKSYITLPVLEIRKMARFPKVSKYTPHQTCEAPGELLGEAFSFVFPYLPAPREDGRSYDMAVIDKGVVYGCNGINKRGYMVAREFKEFRNLAIHKKYVLRLSKIFKSLKEKTFNVSHDDDRIIFESEGVYILVMKSRKPSSEVATSYIKAEGPYTLIKKTSLIKSLDRSTIASFEKVGHPIGVILNLVGNEDSACLNTQLVSGNDSDTVDEIPCDRLGDGDGSDISHVIDYKLFKGIINSLGAIDTLKLYINDQDCKFFKAYGTRKLESTSCMFIGVGAYSRITR